MAPLLKLVLGANAKLLAEFTIPPNVLLRGVAQETITLPDELQKASPRMVVVLMALEVFIEHIQSSCQQCNLDLR